MMQSEEQLYQNPKKSKIMNDPILTYRGAEAHYSELHPEVAQENTEHDPIITYRGASMRKSELYK